MSEPVSGIAGVQLIEPQVVEDDRGLYARLFDGSSLEGYDGEFRIVQAGSGYNRTEATLRGMHYQSEPEAERKVVRCTAGAVYDVVADLRPRSRTCHRWVAVELSAANRRSLIVPPGCAHGYLTLTAGAEVSYLISVPYVRELQRGVRFDDPTLAIAWPRAPAVVSERDASLPFL